MEPKMPNFLDWRKSIKGEEEKFSQWLGKWYNTLLDKDWFTLHIDEHYYRTYDLHVR